MKRKCCNCHQRKDDVDWPISTGRACAKCAKFLGVLSGRVPNIAVANSKKWRDNENAKCTHKGRENSENFYRGFTRYTQGRCRDCGQVSWGPVKA